MVEISRWHRDERANDGKCLSWESMDDILSIKLEPDWDTPALQARFAASIGRADLLQASIAYWTIDPAVFGMALTKRILPPNGFLCVDLHRPTDIAALAAPVRNQADVRLYCEDIPTYGADEGKEPPYLLHTKMLSFWSRNSPAELWVGSHNWTNRAIFGLNVESSLVVELRDSSLFCEAAEYLQKIKGSARCRDEGYALVTAQNAAAAAARGTQKGRG